MPQVRQVAIKLDQQPQGEGTFDFPEAVQLLWRRIFVGPYGD